MEHVPIKPDDAKKLGKKLTSLGALTKEEEALLWAAFAVAADVVSPEGGIGRTSLVKKSPDEQLTVSFDDGFDAFRTDLTKEDVPDRMAAAFSPGRLDMAAAARDNKITKGVRLNVPDA